MEFYPNLQKGVFDSLIAKSNYYVMIVFDRIAKSFLLNDKDFDSLSKIVFARLSRTSKKV